MPTETNEGQNAKWQILLQRLFEFDEQTVPVGLYGIRDHNSPTTPHPELQMEWEHLLKPTMKSLGCQPARYSPSNMKTGLFNFQATAPAGHLLVLRLSKIKVRKYGNAYRVDPHLDFAQRWKEAAIESALNNAWKWRGNQASLVLLIGFGSEVEPFSAELDALQATRTFRQRFRPALTKVWDDPHGRGFKVIAALWVIAGEQNV